MKDFDGWKRAFDQDPLHRARNGVRRHLILRTVADPASVVIHLEFASLPEAETFLEMLRGMWAGVGGVIGFGPDGVQARILEEVESSAY